MQVSDLSQFIYRGVAHVCCGSFPPAIEFAERWMLVRQNFLPSLRQKRRRDHGEMRISPEDIDDFIARWEAAFGERLARDEAEHHASRLLALYGVIARPLPEDATQPSDADDQGRTRFRSS